MNHQPFKQLLLEERARTLQEEQNLWEHVKDCHECHNVDVNWQSVKHQIKTSNMVSPAPGFTARWQANLSVRLSRQRQQRQTVLITVISVAVLITVIVALSIWYIVTSPASIFVAFTRMLAGVIQITALTPQDVLLWLSDMPVLIPVLAGLGLVGWMTTISLTGAATLWRISKKGVVIQ